MRPVGPVRFVIAMILLSLGLFAWMTRDVLAVLILCSSSFFIVRQSELWREATAKQLLITFGSFALLVGVLHLIISFTSEEAFDHIARHPALIIPVWLLTLIFGYRNWRKRRGSVDA